MAERYRFRPLTAIGTAIALSLAPQVSARASDSNTAAVEAELIAKYPEYLISLSAQQARIDKDSFKNRSQVSTVTPAISTVKPIDQTPATQPPQVIPVLTTTTTPSGTIKDGDTKANPTQEDMKKACWYKDKFSDETYTAVVKPQSFAPNKNIGVMLPNCAVISASFWLDESFTEILPCSRKEYYQVIAKNENVAGLHLLNPSILGRVNDQSTLLSYVQETIYKDSKFEGIVDRNYNLNGQLGNTYTSYRDTAKNPQIPQTQVAVTACNNRGTVYFVDQNTFSQPK